MKRMTLKEFWDNALGVYDNGLEMKDGTFYEFDNTNIKILPKTETTIEGLIKELEDYGLYQFIHNNVYDTNACDILKKFMYVMQAQMTKDQLNGLFKKLIDDLKEKYGLIKTPTKKLEITLIDKRLLRGEVKEANEDTIKRVVLEIDKAIIGVGIISICENYIKENNLTDFEYTYREIE